MTVTNLANGGCVVQVNPQFSKAQVSRTVCVSEGVPAVGGVSTLAPCVVLEGWTVLTHPLVCHSQCLIFKSGDKWTSFSPFLAHELFPLL